MTESLSEKVQLFKSVFKGWEDVFAVRWEMKEKSGYMPAYYYDLYLYRAHKIKGGSFKNYNDKSYLKLTDNEIEKHLNEEQHIGIYSLLSDNTSWFLAADFDKENWIDQCKRFITTCSEKGITAYLERSRSGNGGHVWIFFEQPYPAIKSRKIFISLLEETGIISIFDKASSFDRLFPNQDFLSGKGLGNLIALPLFKHTWQQGNNCFVDAETLQPVPDQWAFLKDIKRIAISELDKLYQELSSSSAPVVNKHASGQLQISLDNDVRLSRAGLPIVLISFLREEVNFTNSEFIIKKKIGRNTFGTERYFRFAEETASEVIIPRGFVGRLIRFCRDNKIEYDFSDKRKKLNPVIFSFDAQLRECQNPALENIQRKDIGVIVAPPGSGKTVLA